jgi:hypothetical protein
VRLRWAAVLMALAWLVAGESAAQQAIKTYQPMATQPAAVEPASQSAFRAVLVKYDERADAESDVARLRVLEEQRAVELGKVLGEGLPFARWRLVLSGSEATPMGGIFVRFIDPAADKPRSVRPTYWNSGPRGILRQAEITLKSPLREKLAELRRGATVVVSGNFFPDDSGGPFYESARISSQQLTVERTRFRLPYFAVRLTEVAEP